MARLLTEQQVKDALKIDSFRNLTKEKIMEFTSLIPKLDKEVALNIINQFPAFAESSKIMLDQFKNICTQALENAKDNQKEVILAYRKIIDDLGESLNKDELTPDERNNIIEKMIEVADRMSAEDAENKQFLQKILKQGANLTLAVVFLGTAILGLDVKGLDLPKIKK